MGDDTKQCTKCSQIKLLTDFCWRVKNVKLANECRGCNSDRGKKRRERPEARARDQQRYQDFKKNHPEEVKAREARRDPVTRAISHKRFKENNPEYAREQAIIFRERNPDYKRKHREKNREAYREYDMRRRASKANAAGEFTEEEFSTLCAIFGNKCLRCHKVTKLTRDHVIPLSKGGSNGITNIQPLCLSCNSGKRDHTVDYRPQSCYLNFITPDVFVRIPSQSA